MFTPTHGLWTETVVGLDPSDPTRVENIKTLHSLKTPKLGMVRFACGRILVLVSLSLPYFVGQELNSGGKTRANEGLPAVVPTPTFYRGRGILGSLFVDVSGRGVVVGRGVRWHRTARQGAQAVGGDQKKRQ